MNGLNLDGIGWLIAGGESGPRHGPMRKNGQESFETSALAWIH